MRLSTVPNDPDYVPKAWSRYRVFLDGRLLPHWVTADSDKGEIEAFVLTERGYPLVDDKGAHLEVHSGTVTFEELPEPEVDPETGLTKAVPLPRRERMELLMALITQQFPGYGFALFMAPPETGTFDLLANVGRAPTIEALKTNLEVLEEQDRRGEPEVEADYTWASRIEGYLARSGEPEAPADV